MINTLRIALWSLLLTGFMAMFGIVNAANAHSFNALLVQGGIDGGDVYDAFRLATKEQDGHSNEESDGHLGGLDVYILTPDEFGGLDGALENAAPDFAVFLGPDDPDESIQALLRNRDIVLVQVSEITAQTQADFLDDLQSAGGQGFRDRFRGDYLCDPSETATLAYVAARLIDFAVRAQGDVDNRDALRARLAQYP